MKKKLRLAILTEQDCIPAWSYKMLTKIVNSPSNDIVLLIHNENKKKKNNYFLYNLYTKLDQKYFRQYPDACERKSLNSLLKVNIINRKDTHLIESFKIDIIIQFQHYTVSNKLLQLSSVPA